MSLIHNTKGDISEEYLAFIDWAKNKKNPLKDLTNSQHEFAEWLLTNKEIVGRIGDMELVFDSVRQYLRQ